MKGLKQTAPAKARQSTKGGTDAKKKKWIVLGIAALFVAGGFLVIGVGTVLAVSFSAKAISKDKEANIAEVQPQVQTGNNQAQLPKVGPSSALPSDSPEIQEKIREMERRARQREEKADADAEALRQYFNGK